MRKLLYRIRSYLVTRGLSRDYQRLYTAPGDRKLRALEALRPGDLILRGFDFGTESSLAFGNYSSGGIYDGDEGVVFADHTGVHRIHVFDFLNCDRFEIFRLKNTQKRPKHIRDILFDVGNCCESQVNPTDCPPEFRSFRFLGEEFHLFNIRKFRVRPRYCFKKIKAYLSDSFSLNERFSRVMKYAPKRAKEGEL